MKNVSCTFIKSNEVSYSNYITACIGYKSYCLGIEIDDKLNIFTLRIMFIFFHICIHIIK